MTSSEIFTVVAEFTSRDEAELAILALEEIGFTGRLVMKRKSQQRPVSEWRQGKIVLRKMEPNRHYTYEDVKVWLEEADYSASTAAPLLSLLVKEGAIGKTGNYGSTMFFKIVKEA